LELYPEGPSILSELIQNADDARASSVKVLYNTRSYGTKSLLGPKMASWQGPALYVYNDATFSARDFNNLVKIGQASKLDRLVTTVSFVYVCMFSSYYFVSHHATLFCLLTSSSKYIYPFPSSRVDSV